MFFYLTPLAYCCVPSQREKRWGMNVLLAYGMVLGGKNRFWYSNRMPDWVGTFLARRMAMKLFPMIGPWSHNRQCQNVFFKWSKMINPVENCQAAVRSPFHHFLYFLDSCWLPQSRRKLSVTCEGQRLCWSMLRGGKLSELMSSISAPLSFSSVGW